MNRFELGAQNLLLWSVPGRGLYDAKRDTNAEELLRRSRAAIALLWIARATDCAAVPQLTYQPQK